MIRVLCRNSGGSTGLCLKLEITARDGQQYILTTDDQWFSLRRPGLVEVSLLGRCDTCARAGTVWDGALGDSPPYDATYPHRPAICGVRLRLNVLCVDATAYLASLGLVDLTLNGKLVNKDYFSSGWTDYEKRVYYRAYDVTDLLSQGENACGSVLADGWYSGHIAWGARRDVYGTKPRFRAMLRVEYEDGTDQVFATDQSWSATEGPKKLADFLVGEEYDATAEVPGLGQTWAFACCRRAGGRGGRGVAWKSNGILARPLSKWASFQPSRRANHFPESTCNDVGQNLAGVVRIKVRGRKGQRIMIRHAERLNPDGTLYTTNLRLARAVDFYICKGTGEKIWQPRNRSTDSNMWNSAG